MRDLRHQPQLLLLRCLGYRIACEHRGEPALRGERHLIARKMTRGFVDSRDQGLGHLELIALGRDQPQRHALVARDVGERRE